MDTKPQKPPLVFTTPFALWTELAFKLWGFGQPSAESNSPEKQVAVGVIPTSDARAHSAPKRAKGKVRGKKRAKR